MDRLTWCKENLENLQLEIANDPKYVKLYALSAIVNQMLEWMHRKEDLENINENVGSSGNNAETDKGERQ